MKILAITANYPPDHSGGYGLRLKDIFEGLKGKGYDIQVLTTRINHKNINTDKDRFYPVIRKLHNRYQARFFPREILFDLQDTRLIEKMINAFNPDLIYLGHIYILSKAILPFLAAIDIPILFDEGGACLKNAWQEHGRWFRFTGVYGNSNLIIRALKPILIQLVSSLSSGRIRSEWRWPEGMRVMINSQHNLQSLKDLGMPLENAQVVYSGVDLEKFTFVPRKNIHQPVKILSPGRIECRKGVLDSIELVDALNSSGVDSRLTLIGAISDDLFYQEVLEKITAHCLQDQVSIRNMVSQEELIGLYQNHDFCFFPSYQEMGFSRTPLEAMACGCLVISCGNEGSDEIIQDRKNGYLVKSKDYSKIIKLIKNLLVFPNAYKEMADFARKKIEENYSLGSYINKVNEIIKKIAFKI